MAMGARRLISDSRRSRRSGCISDLRAMGGILSLFLYASDGNQVVGDNAPADVAFEADVALVAGAHHIEAVFECSDARFDARSPSQCSLEPPLLLDLGAGLRSRTARRHRHSAYLEVVSPPLVLCRLEATVGRRNLRCAAENLLVLRNCRHEISHVGGVAVLDLVVADDAVFDFVDPYQPAEFSGLVDLSLSDGLGVGLEQAEDLA